jgi:hypothetical protein
LAVVISLLLSCGRPSDAMDRRRAGLLVIAHQVAH